MGRMILLYDNAADEGTLGGGSWVPTLPLGFMQDPQPSSKARSANLTLGATQFTIALNTTRTFKAIVFGPTNLTSSASYRQRGLR